MRHAIGNLLRELLQGTKVDPHSLLWGILIGACILSALHLITMFATRWGDRRVTGKALLFSLMLHFGCLVGVVTVIPPQPLPPGDPNGGEEPHRVVIHSVRAQPDSEVDSEGGPSGKPAVWDRIPTPKHLASISPQPTLPAQSAAPDVNRVAQPLKPTELPSPDLAVLPDVQQPPAATPAKQELSSPKKSAQTPDIESPKSAPLAATAPAGPQPAERSTAPTATATVNNRQATVPTELPPVASSETGHLEPPAIPDAASPKASVASSAPAESLRPGATPAPVPGLPTDPQADVARAPASAGASAANAKSTMPSARSISPQQSGALSGLVVDRLPSRELSGTTTAQPSEPSRIEDYQALDERPSPALQGGGSGGQPLIVRRSVGIPPTYRLRKLSNRQGNAHQFGGTEQSERSVESSLRWLARMQSPNGRWDAKAFGAGKVKIDENGVDRDYAGRDADSGVTALAVLAFLGAGYTHEEGKYADNVDHALRWLISQQKSDGNLGFDAGHFAMHYCHAIATYAIAEAYGMQNDPTSNTMLREPLLRGVRYILNNQNPDGGWRYLKGQKSDISMSGWQLMALKSAEIAGVNIPRTTKAEVVAFLKARSLGTYGGLAGYREDLPPSATMTAEAMFCKQMLGMRRDNAAAREGAEYLLARLPARTSFNEYYWYYGTLAMYQFGGEGWNSWNSAIRDLLISEQRTDGDYAGSWDPIGPWAQYGGRIYSTALSTLCLEVYYRFLPLYQIGSAPTDERVPKE